MATKEPVTKEAWENWRVDPVTELVFKYLKLSQQALMEQWAAKGFMDDTKDKVLILNAAALGEFEAYQRILGLDEVQLNGVLTDEE